MDETAYIDRHRQFEAVCQAMSDPAFYPHAVEGLKRIDTHISAVFLTGQTVYKIKKPVNFGFLDFRDPADRKHFCRQEVLLNRRLSQGVYKDVQPVHRTQAGGYSLAPVGPVVEYAVCMRQLPDADRLDERLFHHRVDGPDIERIGRRLAEFYAAADRSALISTYGGPDMIRVNMEENFRQLAPFMQQVANAPAWHFICQVSRSFLEQHSKLFKQRIAEAHVCDGHGDLRCDHIYLADDLQIIDCIEFNDRFRYGDLALDLAFLKMDLDHRHHPHLGHRLLDAYVGAAGDAGIYGVIDFYTTYRAIVSLKVTCLQHAMQDYRLHPKGLHLAESYLELAYRYALQFSRPTLWICCGLPATGKSHLARRLARIYRIDRLSTDRLRRDHGLASGKRVVPYGNGAYHISERNRIYRRMLAKAQESLKSGRSVVLDATFSQNRWRDAAFQMAADCDANMVVAECDCGLKIIRKRLRKRDRQQPVSDARLQHLPYMLKDYRRIDGCREEICTRVPTGQPKQQTLRQFLIRAYQMQEAQVRDRLRGCKPVFVDNRKRGFDPLRI